MADNSQILYASLDDGAVIFRVEGRGTYLNAGPFKQMIAKVQARNEETEFILDMTACESVDSTFMGVLAGIGMNQRREKRPNLKLINVSDRVRKLLQTLGLAHILDIRGLEETPTPPPSVATDVVATSTTDVDREQQTQLMIQAHENLVQVDESNAPRFENVLKYLKESLEGESIDDQ